MYYKYSILWLVNVEFITLPWKQVYIKRNKKLLISGDCD